MSEKVRRRIQRVKRPLLSELLRCCIVGDNVTVTKLVPPEKITPKNIRLANEKLALAKRTAYRVTETYGHVFEVRLGQSLLSDGSQAYFAVITKKENGKSEDGALLDEYYAHLFLDDTASVDMMDVELAAENRVQKL